MPKSYENMSFLDFQKRYPDESACEDKLYSFRWPDGFVCPKCGSKEYYDLPRRSLYQCKACKRQTSVTAGTVMHKTRVPLMKWFWTLFLVSTDPRGLSALQLTKIIGVSYKTAWLMLHKIRNAMNHRDASYMLAGIVQVDDAFFKGGVDKGGDKRGRGTSKVPVVVMAATENDCPTYARMEVIENVDEKTIKATLAKHVAPGEEVQTDGLPAYNGARKMGYVHSPHVVYPKHSEPNYDFLKWVNILVSNAKALLLGTHHGVAKKHLQRYLDEYCYRYNRRKWPRQAFDRLLMACSKSPSVGLAELTA